jgi:predicted permease
MASLDELQRNLRYALRTFLRNRLLTCSVVLTLVVGVGLNAAIFSVVNGMVFRARVVRNPRSFVQILTNYHRDRADPWKTSLSDYRAFQAARSVGNLQAWAVVHTTVDIDPRDNLAMLVSCGFFSLYGLDSAERGRVFQESDCAKSGSGAVVVISEEIWKRTFSSDPAIAGRQVLLNHHPYTIIGVTPAGFSGRLRGGGIWIPYTMQTQFFGGTDLFSDPNTPWLTVEGRVLPGQSRSQVQAELARLAPNLSLTLSNGSLLQHPTSGPIVKWVAPLMLGAFGLILLLACANVTMLLLSRAAARQKEMAIRLSLGANRGTLIRMLLTEGILLSLCAGVLSLGLVAAVPSLFERIMWRAPHYVVEADWLVFAYLMGLTLLAGIITGLAPTAESFKLNLNGSLKGQETRFGWRTRDILIGGQVATSLVLLIGAALFARTEFSMLSGNANFETSRVLQVQLNTRTVFPGSIEATLKSVPGVESVCFASTPPLAGKTPDVVTLAGRQAILNFVSPGCFATLGIPLVRGTSDSVVVSQAFALGRNVIGKTVLNKAVSGIARDLTYIRSGVVDGPVIYLPKMQGSPQDSILVRVHGEPEPIAQAISHALLAIDPNQTAVPATLGSRIDETAARFAAIEGIVVILGSVALLLAVIGIYGVVGFAVIRRMKEFGIRLALGATAADVLRAVVGPGLKPILTGLVCGATLAVAGSFGLQQIFRNSPISLNIANPIPYVAVSLILVASAVTAMLLPGLKAAFTVPAKSLRED